MLEIVFYAERQFKCLRHTISSITGSRGFEPVQYSDRYQSNSRVEDSVAASMSWGVVDDKSGPKRVNGKLETFVTKQPDDRMIEYGIVLEVAISLSMS